MITLVAFIFALTTVYGACRTRQLRRGKPAWPGDSHLGVIMSVILGVGCLLVAVFHL